MWSIARMRFGGWFLAAALLCSLSPLACNSNCTAAYDSSVTFTTAVLASGVNAAFPRCSTCKGPTENASYECQSTCPPPNDAGGASTLDVDGGVTTSTTTDNVLTCIVDACATAVLAPHVTCETSCASLYPGVDVTGCSLAPGTVTCKFHVPESCH
jgi:hypothetical protein